MTRDTLVEIVNRRTIYIYAALTGLAVLGVLLTLAVDFHVKIETPDSTRMMNEMARQPMLVFIQAFFGFMIFLTVMATAGLFPRMLAKGTADYYLAQPLSRTSLYLNRFFGVWTVYGTTVAACVIVVALTVAVVYGFWEWRLLYVLLLGLLELGIWLTFTVLMGVLTGSVGATIMTTFALWIVQGLLAGWHTSWREAFVQMFEGSLLVGIVDTLYYILPKMSELSDISESFMSGVAVKSWLPLWSSVLFGVVMMSLTAYIFRRSDY